MKISLTWKLVIGCGLALVTTMAATFYFINLRQERLILRQAENEARAIFRQIIITRKWVADHGGILVERESQKPEIRSSPFIADAEIIDQQGRVFTRETPAMVTKALADYAKEEETYWFHITSLDPVNPDNRPDQLERQALQSFAEDGSDELIATESIARDTYLRYISPLYTERVCLQCHPGYQVGEVRGALSVTIPLSDIFAEAAANRRLLLGAMVGVVVILGTTLVLLLRYLVLTPMQTLATSMQHYSRSGHRDDALVLATGDELQELSQSFADMADRLSDYHYSLEDRIQTATRDLAASNQQLLEANQLLAAANRRKSDFIARASHELRTPLTSIKGGMEYIDTRLRHDSPATAVNQPKSHDELLEFIELIRNNTDRLIRMVNIMLDIERIEMGTMATLNWSTCDLALVIRESVAEMAHTAAGKEVPLLAHGPKPLPIRADEDRLRQVLTNLLANAIKFAPAQSEINIHFKAEGAHAVVEISDQGPGVAAAEEEKIFEKFYKLGDREGSGLGLAICRSIIEAHGGTIGVRPNPEGSGSCFYFSLPRAAPE